MSETRFAIAKWLSLAVIAASVVVLSLTLPVGEGIGLLRDTIEALGPLGYVVFFVVYVLAVVLALPGSLFTLAAGAMFGLWRGFALVSLASTTGAAIAFVLGRYVARDSVARYVQRHPTMAAVDRAVQTGGWRIVALLRLSPVVPFNAQNYLYGVTGIRFWPCVLTSWLAMMPGTFMWVYLAHSGAAGLDAASGARQRTPGEWALLAVGLAATVMVSVLITRRARAELARQVETQPMNDAPTDHDGDRDAAAPSETFAAPKSDAVAGAQPSRVRAALWIGTAALCAALAACAAMRPDWITGLFGPPAVTLSEAYERKPDGPGFDHSVFDGVLRAHVDADGWVDYAALKADPSALDRYIASLAEAPFDAMGRNEKLALLINAYNAFTLRLILDYYPIDSIRDIPAADRWDAVRWNVGGRVWSLNQIEHEEVRPKFIEPRIHFALVCAAVSCPILRNEVYTAGRLEEQLEAQAVYVHSNPRWFERDTNSNAIHVTALYNWYGSDFEQVAGSVGAYIAQFKDEYVITGPIRFLDYDWQLNDVTRRPTSP